MRLVNYFLIVSQINVYIYSLFKKAMSVNTTVECCLYKALLKSLKTSLKSTKLYYHFFEISLFFYLS